MANKQIKDYNQVSGPSLTDTFVCQQSGVTKKQTTAQILSNIANLTAAATLDGSETAFIRVSGVNSKVTIDTLADFIIASS